MKIFSLYRIVAVALVFGVSCSEKPSDKEHSGLLQSGDYALVFDMDTLTIPVQLHVNDKGRWDIINWTEQIQIDSITWTDSTFQAKLPLFNTSLSGKVLNDSTFLGKWTDHTRTPLYEIPFIAKRADLPHFPKEQSAEKLIYSVLFSPEKPLSHDTAIGVFYRYDSLLYGTFLTRSGDHRFLQGRYNKDEITLSGFDGAHMFHYRAKVQGDSLIGRFYSGKHHSSNWIGSLNPQAKLQHPDSISRLLHPEEEFQFSAINDAGDSIIFNRKKLKGRVSIVQISGSWCANCTDESRFFKTLYDKYHDKGLQIIPVAFERSDNVAEALHQVRVQFKELGLAYPPYYGGKMGKGATQKIFPGIDNITAYPTSVFIDKKGEVRKIHTGFYGPGTGDFYHIYTTELESFVQMLLNEENN